jgi:RND family efflux transporter MFP subunit
MKKISISILAVLVVGALIAWKLNSNKQNNQARSEMVKESPNTAVPVLTAQAQSTAASTDLNANGNFKAIKQIDFSAESAGRIVELMVKEGSVVSAGQVLARIDNQVASADLQSAQASVAQAERDLERYETAFASGGVTQKQVDDARLQVRNLKTRLAQASKNSQNTLLRAPINGIINAKYVEVGGYLAPGTRLFEIVDISRLKLVVNVPESQVVQLKVGQKVPVSTNVYPELKYEGTISFIAAKGDASLNYPVEIEVPNVTGHQLKAGMFGTASFGLAPQAPQLMIPRAAFFDGISSNTIYVFANGKAEHRLVVPGAVIGEQVQIREGLKEGETVIISGQINLKDGTPVSVQKS